MAPESGRPLAAHLAAQIADARAWADAALGGLSVAVASGPVSVEDQLYLSKSPVEQLSVTAITQTLAELGARYEVLDPCRPSFIRDAARFDVVLPSMHGPFGEDGRLQGLLDYLRVPCCGSGVAAAAIAADKIFCKRIMESLAIPTPPWRTWPGAAAAWPGRPVMVKSRTCGSSIGMSLVRREEDLSDAIGPAESGDRPGVLIEDHVPGLPVTVGVLELPGGPVVLPPLAIEVAAADFYDAEAKLDAAGAGTATCTEAALPAPVLAALNSAVMKLWNGLGCHGLARADFIVAGDGSAFMLELNITPGMSRESNFLTAAGLLGLSHADILAAILREAVTRQRYDAPLPAPDFSGRRM
jgi:D-alanine-D-alanine ligase